MAQERPGTPRPQHLRSSQIRQLRGNTKPSPDLRNGIGDRSEVQSRWEIHLVPLVAPRQRQGNAVLGDGSLGRRTAVSSAAKSWCADAVGGLPGRSPRHPASELHPRSSGTVSFLIRPLPEAFALIPASVGSERANLDSESANKKRRPRCAEPPLKSSGQGLG